MNNIEININSLFCKTVINLIYLIIECLLIFTLINLNFSNILLTYSCYVIIIGFGEIYRRNSSFNSNIFNKIYHFFYLIKSEPNIVVNNFERLLSIIFTVLFATNLFYIVSSPIILSQEKSNIFTLVNTLITVSAIILPILFTTLQQFENKYSDFSSIIEKWKQTNIRLFIFLAIYTTVSFVVSYVGTNKNINDLLICASIYMILKLILIAINVSLLMGFKLVIVDYKKDIIKWITSLKIERSHLDKNSNLDKMINNILKKGFKNFVKYKIWGLNIKIHYTITDGIIDELIYRIEPIFRIADIFLKENNLNNFKLAVNSIYEILAEYNKISKMHLETNVFLYVAAKIEELFKLSIKLNYQSFLEYIVKVNEKLGLIVINDKDCSTGFKTIQTTCLNAYVHNSSKFVLLSLPFEHTSAPTQAIISLRKYANKLIYNNSLTELGLIIDELHAIAEQIYILNNKQIATNSLWCLNQLMYILVDIINIIYNLVFYELSESESINSEYVLDKSITEFKNIYKILTSYKALSSDFTNMFTNIGTDTKLQGVTKLLSDSPYIKTPYYNSQVQGNRLITDYVNSISQIFNAIFVFDFCETYNFVTVLNKLSKILNLYTFAIKRLIETKNNIDIKNIIFALSEIQNYFILFIYRLEKTKFNQKFLDEALCNFIKYYYETTINILSDCLKQEQWSSYSLESLAILISNTICFCSEIQISYQNIIFEFIKQIIELYHGITDEHTQKEFFKFINLMTLISCEKSSKTKISKILLKFVKDNMPTPGGSLQFDFDGTEQNNLPNYSSHLGVDYIRISQYVNFLSKSTKSKKKK